MTAKRIYIVEVWERRAWRLTYWGAPGQGFNGTLADCRVGLADAHRLYPHLKYRIARYERKGVER